MSAHEQSTRPRWSRPLPVKVAQPTYWPATLALGMTLVLLGPVTAMAISIVGAGLAAAALVGWIGDIERE